ncbi:hypothetical protein [uncultured Akkermansia sp.]|uniref:hypothetical protein n=1 Tax=uncultured Akkermansia sp. TaxID=512294 RepID=UPI00265CBB96|nr:hypothetical protein [uncultured Akkermansia sp.]
MAIPIEKKVFLLWRSFRTKKPLPAGKDKTFPGKTCRMNLKTFSELKGKEMAPEKPSMPLSAILFPLYSSVGHL